MAITIVNLSDPVSTFVNKTNIISADVGDIEELITGDSNVVNAINSVYSLPSIDDSAEIIALARSGLSVVDQSGGPSLTYDSSTGVLTLLGGTDSAQVISILRSDLSSGAGLDFDSTTGQFSVASSGITSSMIGSGQVGTTQLATNAVTNAKIGDDAVGQAELKDATILTIKNSAGTVIKTLYGAGS